MKQSHLVLFFYFLKEFNDMDPMLEKTFTESKALLFGLIQGCIFSEYALEDCPLLELRDKLSSLADKYAYVIQLGDDEVDALLRQHEECIAERGATYMQG